MHLKKIIKPNYGNTFNDDLGNKNKIVRMYHIFNNYLHSTQC